MTLKFAITSSALIAVIGSFLAVGTAFAVATPKADNGAVILNVPIGEVGAGSILECIPVELGEGDYGYANSDCSGEPEECTGGSCDNFYKKGLTYDPNVSNSLLAKYIKLIYNYLTGIITALAGAMIIWGGVEWTRSAGNQSAIDSGKEKIFSALIGLAIFALAGLILWTINPTIFGTA